MPTVVVIGHGMVGQRFCEELARRDPAGTWEVDVVGAEPVPAYDRVALSRCFEGADPADLSLVPDGFFDGDRRRLHLGDAATDVDLRGRLVRTASGRRLRYDALVLATGSDPFVPPVPGRDLPGCVAYRTVADVAAMRALAPGASAGVVVGGGLLGLEAANGLRLLGLDAHVVEAAPRLLPVQLDAGGAAALRHRVEALGLTVHLAGAVEQVEAGPDGRAAAVRLADRRLECQLVVFAAGIRPADALARSAGLAVHERGGVLVDDTCRTSDPNAYAVGEVAVAAGRTWGLVAPGYAMAAVVADRLTGGTSTFTGADLSTRLKLLGVEVGSVGDAHGVGGGVAAIVLDDPRTATYKRVNVDASGRVVGAVLVGDLSGYATLLAMARGDLPSPEEPAALVAPAPAPPAGAVGAAAVADAALACSCNGVTAGTIRQAARAGATDARACRAATGAGSGCGGCAPLVADLLAAVADPAAGAAPRPLCEHFPMSRPRLFEVVRSEGHRSFGSLLEAHGAGRGCDVCRPAVASMLASLGAGYILDGEQAALQDTNDHFLANLQRDGTYSVVPRIPGGEVTPEGLIAIGEVARDFRLYTKITGGQRIDLLGATVEQLPAIWARLVEAGFESGHAYGKAVRTVKSCVGSTWCRYGVQDSVAMAVALELRYRGLRAPHKLKLAVSGCARECAEAQSKDVGVIATERGWNLYVGGNGGQRPRHARLLAEDLDDERLVQVIDRFLAYYVLTADRLERTATWLEKLDGGLDHLRRVVVDDALGIAGDLDAMVARHVESYRCEWAETLADPGRSARFAAFVNQPGGDPNVVFVTERGQPRPARPAEKPPPATVDTGAALVRVEAG